MGTMGTVPLGRLTLVFCEDDETVRIDRHSNSLILGTFKDEKYYSISQQIDM